MTARREFVDVVHVYPDDRRRLPRSECGNSPGLHVVEAFAASKAFYEMFPDDVICSECAAIVANRRKRDGR